MAHTPGPWLLATAEGCAPLVIKPGVHDICQMLGASSNDSVMADARLIAAAPTMLEALAQINYWVCYVTEEDIEARLMAMQQIGVHARAAIAKATS
jgi:hypothetical protein